MALLKCFHIWLFKVIHSKMVRWVEIDRQGLAAAAECIYRYYHPVRNAGDLRWRHAIRLQWENDITSKREGQIWALLQLPFLEQNLLTSGLMSDLFLKTEFGKQLWAHCYRCNKPVPPQPPTGFLFYFIFWQADYRVCKPAVFTHSQPSTQW